MSWICNTLTTIWTHQPGKWCKLTIVLCTRIASLLYILTFFAGGGTSRKALLRDYIRHSNMSSFFPTINSDPRVSSRLPEVLFLKDDGDKPRTNPQTQGVLNQIFVDVHFMYAFGRWLLTMMRLIHHSLLRYAEMLKLDVDQNKINFVDEELVDANNGLKYILE